MEKICSSSTLPIIMKTTWNTKTIDVLGQTLEDKLEHNLMIGMQVKRRL